MQELLWYALSHGLARPVPDQDVPLWFAALLILGLLCAGALIGSGTIQWFRSLHKKRANLLSTNQRVDLDLRPTPSRGGSGPDRTNANWTKAQ